MYQFAIRMVDTLHRAVHLQDAGPIRAGARPVARSRLARAMGGEVASSELLARYACTRDPEVLAVWCNEADAQLALAQVMELRAAG